MNQLNSLIVEGKVEEFSFKEQCNGFSVAEFKLCCERSVRNIDGEWETEKYYFDCIAFGETAVSMRKHVKKDTEVRVIGRLKQERWEYEGKLCSKVRIVVEHCEFRSTKNGNNGKSSTSL